MAKSFYIKSIQSISNQGEISKVDFVNGFNLIHGPSNTGKTLILKCVDYLFGASKVDGLDNQDYLIIDLVCESGTIQIKRYLEENKNKVYLRSSIPDIESGEYPLVSKTKMTLSDIFLTLLGVDQLPIKVIKNENFVTQNLTWRTFLHIFFLKESEILREGSILDPKTNTSLTAFRSSLLFLINGEDQAPLEKEESPDSIKLKNQAVRAYVNNKLKKISEEESKISETLKNISKEEAENHLNDALHQVNYNNDALSKITKENKMLTEENTSLFVEREENSISIRNFEELIDQYKIDLNRLSFIVEGNRPMHSYEEDTPCPFCNSKITEEDNLVNLESVAIELKNIQIKLKDLTETLELLKEEDIALENKIKSNQTIINQNSHRINKILAPAIKELENTIREYNMYFNLQTEKATLRKMASEWNEDLSDYDDDKIEDNKYKPLDRFPLNFFRNLSTILETNLKKCSFPNLSTARFDRNTFDVSLNGEPKSSQGKGYRAYLNSVVSLSMLEYLDLYATYPIPIFMVDTPLLGLDEAIADQQTTKEHLDNMRYAFYKFLIETGNHRQIILIDNNKNLPKMDWNEYSLHTVEFTKNEDFGRYGFLKGVTD